MPKFLMFFLGGIAFVAIFWFRLHHHHAQMAAPDLRADDDHPVHIAMGGHDFVIPRWFLVTSPGDDAHLNNGMVGSGRSKTFQVAAFNLAATFPGLRAIPSKDRVPPYGGQPDGKVLLQVVNEPPPQRRTLRDLAADLQAKNIKYTSGQGPFNLMVEQDTAMTGPVKKYRLFGGLYGGELMITCEQEPGFSCHFRYPLDDMTLTVSFPLNMLKDWSAIYSTVVPFIMAMRKD